MALFINRVRLVEQLKASGRPQDEVLGVLRAQGLLKTGHAPLSLQKLAPEDIRWLATRDREQRAKLDIGIVKQEDIPTITPGKAEKLLDSTVWRLRDKFVHEKLAPLRARAIAALALRELGPQHADPVLGEITATAALVHRNFLGFPSGLARLGDVNNFTRELRRQGIYQDPAMIPYDEAALYATLSQDGGHFSSHIDKMLSLPIYSMQPDIQMMLTCLKHSHGQDSSSLRKDFEQSLLAIGSYYSEQEPKEWKLVSSSFIVGAYMAFLLGFRIFNFIEQGTLITDSVAALLLLWPELSCYYDTMVNRFMIAYGVHALRGGHGQTHLPKQISLPEHLTREESQMTHVVHAFGEATSVCYMHLLYGARNLSDTNSLVFWDASLNSYFMLGARGSVEVTRVRLALQGLFLGAIRIAIPELTPQRAEDLAKRLTDIDPELDDPEMNHLSFFNRAIDQGADGLGIGNRKIRLFAEAASPVLLRASCHPESWDRSISIAGLQGLAVKLGISEEKAKLLAERVYNEGLSISRRAQITRLSQHLIENADRSVTQQLANLISAEYHVPQTQANGLLNDFLAERNQAISSAYDTVMPLGRLLRTADGRALFVDIYKYMDNVKTTQEKEGNIPVEQAEIFRQLIDRVLFVEHENGLSRRIKNVLTRQDLVKQMAIEISDEIDQKIKSKANIYDLVAGKLGRRNDVTPCDFVDAENEVFGEVAGQIYFIVTNCAAGHGVSAADAAVLADTIVNEWFVQNSCLEARIVAISLANIAIYGVQNLAQSKILLERDFPAKKSPGFHEAAMGFTQRAVDILGAGT